MLRAEEHTCSSRHCFLLIWQNERRAYDSFKPSGVPAGRGNTHRRGNRLSHCAGCISIDWLNAHLLTFVSLGFRSLSLSAFFVSCIHFVLQGRFNLSWKSFPAAEILAKWNKAYEEPIWMPHVLWPLHCNQYLPDNIQFKTTMSLLPLLIWLSQALGQVLLCAAGVITWIPLTSVELTKPRLSGNDCGIQPLFTR